MILVAGCGFVGSEVLRLFKVRHLSACGITRGEESRLKIQAELELPVISSDIADLPSMRRAAAVFPQISLLVSCVSSGKGGADAYRAVYLEGARNLMLVCPSVPLLFVSSTSVYAQNDGSWVNENSPTLPDRETGRVLLEAEKLTLQAGGVVLRPGGIYGPGRSVFLKRFLDGSAVLEGDGQRYINQIHRDDVAAAIVELCCAEEWPSGEIFNCVDGSPAAQREVYSWLSERLNRPLPPSAPPDPNRKRGASNKRVSNAKLCEFGWSPRFPTFREGLEGLLHPEIEND